MIQNEVGRELAVNKLEPKTIVVLRAANRPAVTMWVAVVGMDFVAFYAGVTKTTFIAQLREDGSLADDAGRVIKVYEYLGEP